MRSDIEPRCGSTRGIGPSRFRVQVSLDGGPHFDVLVMKRDDRDGRGGTNDVPYRVEWAATGELEREAKAVLGGLELKFSAKHNKAELRKFLKRI